MRKASTIPDPKIAPLPSDMEAEYRFDYTKAKPNRFAKKEPARVVVVLDPDLSEVFTTPESVNTALRASSQLVTLAGTNPIPPFALVTRMREDVPRLQTALDSFGYYHNSVSVTAEGLGPDDPELPTKLDALTSSTPAKVKIAVTMGPLYHIGKVTQGHCAGR